jgi:hypothetical protein
MHGSVPWRSHGHSAIVCTHPTSCQRSPPDWRSRTARGNTPSDCYESRYRCRCVCFADLRGSCPWGSKFGLRRLGTMKWCQVQPVQRSRSESTATHSRCGSLSLTPSSASRRALVDAMRRFSWLQHRRKISPSPVFSTCCSCAMTHQQVCSPTDMHGSQRELSCGSLPLV